MCTFSFLRVSFVRTPVQRRKHIREVVKNPRKTSRDMRHQTAPCLRHFFFVLSRCLCETVELNNEHGGRWGASAGAGESGAGGRRALMASATIRLVTSTVGPGQDQVQRLRAWSKVWLLYNVRVKVQVSCLSGDVVRGLWLGVGTLLALAVRRRSLPVA